MRTVFRNRIGWQLFLVVWSFVALWSVLSAQQPQVDAAIARFEIKIAADVAKDSIGGITAGVFVRDRVIWKKGFGWADVQQKVPADGETIYRIGSVSKCFTAVLMVQMCNKGYFSLNDEVRRYLPEANNLVLPPGAKPVTILQLATHTSGFAAEPDLPNSTAGPITIWEDKVIASIPTVRFVGTPGEKYSYSNYGFGVLGLTVSRAVKRPFMDLVTENIFKPLGMTHSAYIYTEDMRRHLATGYGNEQGGPPDPEQPAREHAGRGYKVPPGGIYSSVDDLARFAMSQMGILSLPEIGEKDLKEIQRPHVSSGRGGSYGLGFTITQDSVGHTFVGHGGSVAGYTANLIFEPTRKIGVVILRNYNRGSTNLGQAARDLLRELLRGD